MPLDEYRAKRDFTRTPEPQGGPAARRAGPARFFCVQKHLATSLHYDFRLEHNGVLLSWAVPKGPSLDPTVRRLAMHVEDHPIEYGTFEGVIPEGYGAGVVLLWDQGTWEPEMEDVDAALAKGDLKLRLNGYKLKGSWALVRTRTRGAGPRGRGQGGAPDRAWLLIKHRDEWSGDLDIAEFATMSVKSGGDFADVLAQEVPDVWTTHREGSGTDTLTSLAKIVEKVEALQKSRPAAEPDTTAERRVAAHETHPTRAKRQAARRPDDASAPPRPAGPPKTRKATTPRRKP